MKQEEYKALVQAAREADLVTYFQQNGFSVERKGSEFYVKEYPSLCIKPSTNQWYFHYTREGATNNSINCLTKVLGMDFNQAVFSLTGQDISRMRSADYPRAQRPAMTTPPRTPRREPEKKELQMPEQSEQTGRLFAYLCQTRKIPPHIVEELLHTGLLYQSENTVHCERDGQQKTFHNANAVFVHRDTTGNAIGAEIQGLNSFKGKRLSMKSLYSTETVRHRPADQNAENRQSNYWNAICGTSSGVIQIFMFSMRYFIWTNQEAFEQDFDHYDKDNWLDALPEELSEALKRFPKEQLHAFFLNRVEGYTQQEIAAMMSISQPTAFRLIGEIHEIISSVNKTGVLTGCIIEGDEKNASQNLEN